MMSLFLAIFMVLTRCCSQGRPIVELEVRAPPPMNTMEQLLAVQNAVSHITELIQDGNIVLLKLRALLLASPSQVHFESFLSMFCFVKLHSCSLLSYRLLCICV